MSVVLVTGAASGIGQHLVGRLLSTGHTVIAADIDIGKLQTHASAEGWTADLCELDVRNTEHWQIALDRAQAHGSLDIVMNVAGYLCPGPAHELTEAMVDRHMDVNAKGVIHGTRLAASVMVKQGSGHIINIASIAGIAPVPGLALYSASKHAVRAFSIAAAEDLRKYGVAVSVVCPDAVHTPMLELQRDYEDAAITFATPHILTVEEVGALILGRVMSKRPVEVAIPRLRQVLAHIANVSPRLSRGLLPLLRRFGRWRRDKTNQGG